MAVTITKPASGATLAGIVAVEATYSGQNFVLATVSVDGQQLGSDSSKPISFLIDTLRVGDGAHTLTVAVKYRTSGGNLRWQKASIPITTEGNDMEVVISTNQDTSNLSGTVVVTATVTPPGHQTPLTSCKFYVDNVLKSTDTSYPLTFSWDTTLGDDGDHVLKATVIAKRTKTSSPLPVKVKNAVTPPEPPPIQDPPVNTAAPAISGTATEGQTLTVSTGTWTNNPTSYTRQWMRCDAAGANGLAIPGATNQSYQLGAADVGATLRCVVTAFNIIGPGPAIQTAQTAVISALAPTVPVLVTTPVINGNPVVGNGLAVSDGSWTQQPTSYKHCWSRCDANGANCVDIDNGQDCTAYNAQYVVTAADVGDTIKCWTTAVNAAGNSTPVLSAATAVVTGVAPPPPGGSLLFNGDFDTGGLSQWDFTFQMAADRLRAVTSDSAVTPREGSHMARVEVRSGDDPISTGGNICQVVRSAPGKWDYVGDDRYYAFSVFLPNGFPYVPAQLFNYLFEMHGDTSAVQAPFKLGINSIINASNPAVGFHVELHTGSGFNPRIFRIGDLITGQWVDFVCHLKWSRSTSGVLEIWQNGVKKVDQPAIQTWNTSTSLGLVKAQLGYYRANYSQTAILYVDACKIGTSYSIVAP